MAGLGSVKVDTTFRVISGSVSNMARLGFIAPPGLDSKLGFGSPAASVLGFD